MSLGAFVVEVALFVGLATLIGLPVMVVAYQKAQYRTMRKFLLAGGIVGVLLAILSSTSDLLVERCLEAGNTGCLDYGAVGIRALILIVYGLVALIAAVRLLRS